MPLLMLKDLPRYECLIEAARKFPDMDPSASEAYLNLLRAGDDAYRRSETFLQGHGMSPGRFTMLMLLYDKKQRKAVPKTPAELAEDAGVTRATITGLLDTLERDGLARREHVEGDRRMMRVHLTPKGVESLELVLPGYFKQMAAQMAGLSESERKLLVRLLTKIGASAPSETSEPQHAEVGM